MMTLAITAALTFGLSKIANPSVTNQTWTVERNVAIWANAQSGRAHNAFPQMQRFGSAWYVALREGSTHASTNGVLRVIRSTDNGTNWTSCLCVTNAWGAYYSDLRGNALATDGTTLVCWAGWDHQNSINYRWSSHRTTTGTAWTTATNCVADRVPHTAIAYGGNWYLSTYDASARLNWLHRTSDFGSYTTVSNAWGQQFGEGALWMDGSTMRCLVRRVDASYTTPYHYLSSAASPYTSWTISGTRWPRCEGAGASPAAGARFGQCIVGRDFDFAVCDYVAKANSSTMLWSISGAGALVPRAVLSSYTTDGGYGDCEEYGGRLYCCYYAGSTTSAEIYWVQIRRN